MAEEVVIVLKYRQCKIITDTYQRVGQMGSEGKCR